MKRMWLALLSGTLLLLSVLDLPYNYYVFLRWFVTGTSLVLVYDAVESKLMTWIYVFGGVAILFNPIFPFYLDKQTWVIIDLIVATMFFVSNKAIKKLRMK